MDMSKRRIDEDRMSVISQCSKAVADLHKADLVEIKSFCRPPVGVIDVLTGTMILLGHTGAELEWKNIKKYLGKVGKESVQARVEALDFENIPTETRKKAMDVLSKYTTDEVKCKSMAASTLHKWAVAVADE